MFSPEINGFEVKTPQRCKLHSKNSIETKKNYEWRLFDYWL